jgi:hypothetical protein
MTEAKPRYGREAMRKCLRCQKQFKSHSVGNRICNYCAALNKNERGPMSCGTQRHNGIESIKHDE